MVNKIYELKNKFIQRIEKNISERGIDRIDINEMDKLVDMVKDLAEAEKSCWEASYYRSVSEAMESGQSSGYSTQQPANDSRRGYSSMGYGSMGYGSMGHSDIIEQLGNEFKSLRPEERSMMRDKVLATLGMM